MRVEVENHHIQEGVKGSTLLCPVALALGDKGCLDVKVMRHAVLWKDDDEQAWCANHPADVEDWIYEFDSGREVEPLTFDLEPSVSG